MSRKKIPNKCLIPTVWCGESNTIPKISSDGYNRYTNAGSRHQCMKIGFGAGLYKSENIKKNSIRTIKYIGEVHEASFKKNNISTTTQLIVRCQKKSPDYIQKLLKKILTKNNGTLDTRAFNSTIIFLFHNDIDLTDMCQL